jgi:hypothetical protein
MTDTTNWEDDHRTIEEAHERMAERAYRYAHPETDLAYAADDAARLRLDLLNRRGSDAMGTRLAARHRPPRDELEIALLESELAGNAVPGVLGDWAKSPSFAALFESAGGGRVFVPLPRLGDAIAEAATILYPNVAGRTDAVEGQQLLPMPTGPLSLFTVDDSFEALEVDVPTVEVGTPAAYGGLAVGAASQETVLTITTPPARELTRIATI